MRINLKKAGKMLARNELLKKNNVYRSIWEVYKLCGYWGLQNVNNFNNSRILISIILS